MEHYLPSYSLVYCPSYRYGCIPYPTFAQLLTRLDRLQPNFGWEGKLTQPLLWLFGNIQPLDSITIDRLHSVVPQLLCVVFDIPPAWVLCFCEEALRAMETARTQALKMHRHGENHLYCRECGDHLTSKYCSEEQEF